MADTTPTQPPDDAARAEQAPAPVKPRPTRPAKVEVRHFSPAELAQFDGADGRPAYVAYKGFVFDVSSSLLWRKGKHVNEHTAGADLTVEMARAPHIDDVMARFPIVGVLDAVAESGRASARAGDGGQGRPPSGPSITPGAPPAAVDFLLKRHMHPVTVHYPIALGFVAALFTLASLIPGLPAQGFRDVAWWMLVVSALFTAPAAVTGLWSWWYNYGAPLSWVYKWKIGLTLTLCAISAAAIALHFLGAGNSGAPAAFWAYSLLVVAHGPVVIALGWFGGKITFPD